MVGGGADRRRSGGGPSRGWGLRGAAVACCGAADSFAGFAARSRAAVAPLTMLPLASHAVWRWTFRARAPGLMPGHQGARCCCAGGVRRAGSVGGGGGLLSLARSLARSLSLSLSQDCQEWYTSPTFITGQSRCVNRAFRNAGSSMDELCRVNPP